MRKQIIILILFLTCIALYMHGVTLRFVYDQCGNRTKREIVMSQKVKQETTITTFNESFKDRKIVIHPNPTNGILKIEVIDEDVDPEYSVVIYNMAGSLILSYKTQEPTTECNIQSQNDGLYILRIIFTDGEESVWKIIKD